MRTGGKYKTLTLQERMEVLNKLDHGASIQSVIKQYGVSSMVHVVIKLKSGKGQLDPRRTKLMKLFTTGTSNNVLWASL
jgi:hypothetical protein